LWCERGACFSHPARVSYALPTLQIALSLSFARSAAVGLVHNTHAHSAEADPARARTQNVAIRRRA
jgi:hypothetical protein